MQVKFGRGGLSRTAGYVFLKEVKAGGVLSRCQLLSSWKIPK